MSKHIYTISYYKNVRDRKGVDTALYKILDAIKNGKYKSEVEAVRLETDKKKRSKLKTKLAAFTVSGTFPKGQRKANSIISHSGLIQIDFDDVENCTAIIERLNEDEYTLCSFISPSGNGIKLIVKIPPKTEHHKAHFLALEKYYFDTYNLEIDKSAKDVTRLFFVSYDKGLFLNEKSNVFDTSTNRVSKVVSCSTHDDTIAVPEVILDDTKSDTSVYKSVTNDNNGVTRVIQDCNNVIKQKDTNDDTTCTPNENRVLPIDVPKVVPPIVSSLVSSSTTSVPHIIPSSTKKDTTQVTPVVLSDKFSEVQTIIERISMSKIDITGNYEKWRNIGFALCSEFGENGRTFFHDISQFGSDYDIADCDSQYSAFLSSSNSGITIKTFFAIAKENGIDINTYTSAPVQPKKTTTAVKKKQKKKAKYPKEDFAKNQFYQENGKYIGKSSKGAKMPISNFTAEAMYLFPDGTNDAKRLMKITNKQNGETLLEISSSDSVSLGKFKGAIRSKGNYTFFGSALNLDFMTTALFKEEITANKLNTMGYLSESGIYAFANGILDKDNNFKEVNEYGVVVEDGESYFLPPFSSLYENDSSYDTQRGFKYRKGKIDLDTFAKLMLQAYGKKGVIGTAFLVAALYRDIVFKHQGHFPFLYLFGSAGGGKTTFMEIMLMPFIEKINHWGISINSSEKGIMRKITNAQNSIFYLKEFNSNAVGDRMVEMLKNAYDGQGYDRAATTNDNRTHQTKIGSAMVLDGNYLPTQQSALLDRMIVIDFNKRDFNETTIKGRDLLLAAKEEGAGQLVQEILSKRESVLKKYYTTFENLYKTFKADLGMGISERTLNNLCSICAPICTLDIKVNGFKEVLLAGLISYAKEQDDIMRNIDEINTFWSCVEENLRSELIHTSDDKIYIMLNSFYKIYVQYMKDNNNSNILDYSTLYKLIANKNYPYFIEKSKQIKKGNINKRYMVFKISVLK